MCPKQYCKEIGEGQIK